MTREMNIFKFDGQTVDPTEQEVNMIHQLRADQGEDNNSDKESEDKPQSFEEMCDEEIKLFEMRSDEEYGEPESEDHERRFNEEFRLFEEREWRICLSDEADDDGMIDGECEENRTESSVEKDDIKWRTNALFDDPVDDVWGGSMS